MTCTAKAARYYKRHRRIRLATPEMTPGPEVSALITRYRMGARRKRPRYVYSYGGRWYIAKNLITDRDASGTPCAWEWSLVPATGTAWDAYASQTLEQGRAALVQLTLKDGALLTKAYALVSDLEEQSASDTGAWYDWLDTSLLLAETGALLARAYARQAMED